MNISTLIPVPSKVIWIAAVSILLLSSPANHAMSQDAQTVTQRDWKIEVGLSSGQLASEGWQLVTSSGLSWRDGKQAVVTFWRSEKSIGNQFFRCTSYFDDTMISSGDKCERPR